MLDVVAIARCHRCNVISLPLRPSLSDPTYAAVSIPLDWSAVRVFMDGETDAVLCPACTREAWEWLTTRIERKPSNEGQCLAEHYWSGTRYFCDLERGHAGPCRGSVDGA